MKTRDVFMNTARVIEVVETTFLRGKGVEGSPIRIITQYWDKKGNLLAERDPLIEEGNALQPRDDI